MKPMSLQQVRKFWSYLHDQEDHKIQIFVGVPYGSPYKDEVRAEAESYQLLAQDLAKYLSQPITDVLDIQHGLTSQQVSDFLDSLNTRIRSLRVSQEEIQQKRQAALTESNDGEYSETKRIYKESETILRCQCRVFEFAREILLSILEE